MKIHAGNDLTTEIMNHSIEECYAHYLPKAGKLDFYEACHPCDRFVWLAFRRASTWAIPCNFYKRIKRFDVEKDIQAAYIDAFVKIPVKTKLTSKDYDYSVTFKCFKDIPDGIIEKGIPESPNNPHILAVQIINNPVYKMEQVTRRAHLLMHFLGIKRTLLVCCNTETEEVKTSRFKYDKELAEKYLNRALNIIMSDDLPTSTDNTDNCQNCPYSKFCYETHKTDIINCMTCACLTINDNGMSCAKNLQINLNQDKYPCHILNTGLVPYDVKSIDWPNVAYYLENGKVIYQGDTSFSSEEFLNGYVDTMVKVADAFDGRIEYSHNEGVAF